MNEQPDRSRFLHPPPEHTAPAENAESRQKLQEATDLLHRTFADLNTEAHFSSLLMTEAKHSAAIEDEYRENQITLHHRALLYHMAQPQDRGSLLDMHRIMMAGQHHAQPGWYRTVNVRIGRHRPPAHPLVPSLMDELFTYLSETQDNPLLTAAWAHIQFETVHPFADGNGRTGRAIIHRILEAPLPLSVYILENQQEYYRMLDRGSWTEYLDWFLNGVTATCQTMQPDSKRAHDPPQTARWNAEAGQ